MQSSVANGWYQYLESRIGFFTYGRQSYSYDCYCTTLESTALESLIQDYMCEK